MSREQSLQHGITSAALLSFAGWLASKTSSKAPTLMPTKQVGRRGGRSAASGPGGLYPINQQDLKVRPLSLTNVPKRIPRNISSLIAWDVFKIDVTSLIFSSGTNESNTTVRMNSNAQFSQWTSLYDQYAIPMFTCIFRSNYPPGATYPAGMMYTALDFDNANTLGSVQLIQDFSTCDEHLMTAGVVVQRSIRPSIKGVVGAVSGSQAAEVAGPVWLDSGTTDVSHFGIRCLLGPLATTAYSVNIEVVIYYCFRNNI